MCCIVDDCDSECNQTHDAEQMSEEAVRGFPCYTQWHKVSVSSN